MASLATFWGLSLCFLLLTILCVVAFTRLQKSKQQSSQTEAGKAQKVGSCLHETPTCSEIVASEVRPKQFRFPKLAHFA